jgi:hypothetical protein
MTKIESLPSAGGKSVIKSMLQCANGRVDIAPSTGIKDGCDGFQSILNCWQIPHSFDEDSESWPPVVLFNRIVHL